MHCFMIPSQQRWHVFISYLIVIILSTSITLFRNRALAPNSNSSEGYYLVMDDVFLTIISALHVNGTEHATKRMEQYEVRYSNGFFASLLPGLLNSTLSN